MANKMLIDATHPEETRVVVVRGNRVEEFDYESASRKQLRGNIYLAKVTRVEPSLQAAFIEYGGNRHGFLAFSEIHPDYYQIPVADRLALIEEEERAARLADDEADLREKRRDRERDRNRAKRAAADQSVSQAVAEAGAVAGGEAGAADVAVTEVGATEVGATEVGPAEVGASEVGSSEVGPAEVEAAEIGTAAVASDTTDTTAAASPVSAEAPVAEGAVSAADETSVAETSAAAGTVAEAAAQEGAAGPDDPAPEVTDAAEAVPFRADPVTELLVHAEAAEAAAEAREAEVEAQAEAEFGTPLPAPQLQHADADEAARRAEAEEGEQHPAPILEGEAPPAEARSPVDDEDDDDEDSDVEQIEEDDEIEHLGADEDALEEVPERMPQRRARSYKIQEVIRRRQVMLVQVVKEERGNKGAALTTYLSLAGRYSVLMPNTARGGGISRKITNAVDRKRLKDVVQDLEVPEGMGVILRTAGANRTKTEIKRDFEYLLRLWETVRELTLSSAAPSLVYEEGSLIKRAIRDLYNKDIDDILVAGEDGYKEAKDFMRMLMPSHAKSVLPYGESQPIFARYGVEQQLDAMFSPVVQLKSGGYVVINPTEALVSIDVNSGRATREHHIEDTALKTNLEAAEEIARQLRLRDLAGLIVIDFIDMEEKRNNRAVERKLKDCLKNDRARIQIGRISHFGLLEMSRQRIRTGVLESSIEVCPHCGGTGHVRSAASVALQLLRALEEQLLRASTHNLVARTRTEVALYVLNQKRAHLRELEERFSVTLSIAADDEVTGHQPFLIEKGEPAAPAPAAPRPSPVVQPDSILPDEDFVEEEDEEEEEAPAEEADESARRRRRRRRRRRPGEREDGREARPEGTEDDEAAPEAAAEEAETDEDGADEDGADEDAADDERADDERTEDERTEEERADEERGDDDQNERRRRRRGRRGGRRNRREREGEDADGAEGDAAAAAGPDEAVTGEAVTGEPADVDAGTKPAAEAEPAQAEEQAEETAAENTVAEETPAPVPAASAEEMASAGGATAPEAAVSAEAADQPAVSAPAPKRPAAAAPADAGPVEEPAPRRRRSAVREKAPVADSAPPAVAMVVSPPTAPVADAAAEDKAAPDAAAAAEDAKADAPDATPQKPRSGWWQRKLFGE